MSGTNYEGYRRVARVKTRWQPAGSEGGDDAINGWLRKGWVIMEISVYHGEDHPSIVWILGHEGVEFNEPKDVPNTD